MKILLKVSFLLVCLLGIASLAHGQVVVSGRVVTGVDEPIPGLTVYFIDEAGQRFPPEDDDHNMTDQDGKFTVGNVVLETWYTVEVYSGKALRFTDYVFVEGEEEDTVELPDFTVDY